MPQSTRRRAKLTALLLFKQNNFSEFEKDPEEIVKAPSRRGESVSPKYDYPIAHNIITPPRIMAFDADLEPEKRMRLGQTQPMQEMRLARSNYFPAVLF